MKDWDGDVSSLGEWRDRNRGLMVALSACLALWIVAIMLVIHY